MARKAKEVVEYRHYHLPMEFPVLLISGKDWKISATKSSRLHFHTAWNWESVIPTAEP